MDTASAAKKHNVKPGGVPLLIRRISLLYIHILSSKYVADGRELSELEAGAYG